MATLAALRRSPRIAPPAAPDGRLHRPPWSLVLVAGLAAGILQWAAFPPVSWWPLAPLGVTVLTLGLRGSRLRQGLAAGLLCGLALLIPLLSWLRVVGWDGWLALSVFEALFFAVLGGGLTLVLRLPGWPLWAAVVWVTEEWARGRVPFGGFTWGRLAFSQAEAPTVHYAALAGAPLVSFAVALAGTGLAGTLIAARRRRAPLSVGGAALVAAVLCSGLAIPLPTAGQASAAGPATVTAAVVQGNVPALGLSQFARAAGVLQDHLAETKRLAAEVAAGRLPRPDLVIWPENASDLDPYTNAAAAAAISDVARAVGVPILVGAVIDGPGPNHVRNTGIVWDPVTGPGQMYVKRHPVPFGEYIPFRSVLTKVIGRFSLIPKDFAAGHRPGVLTVGPARIGDVICFEVAYDNVVRDAVRSGGRLIVVQTNDATFERGAGRGGRSGETAQQLAMAQLRAVEHGRAVLVAATSGVSAVIEPDGRIVQRTRVFTPALLVARVPLRDSRTIADTVGAWPEWGLALLGLLAAVVAAVRSRVRGSRKRPGHTSGGGRKSGLAGRSV